MAQQARQGPWVDTRALPGLVDAAVRRAPLRVVLADAEFDSEANHQHIRQRCSAQSIIPAQPRRGVPRGILRRQMYRAFPQKEYAQRAKVETIFSVVKRKLSSRAPGRSLRSQIRQALLLGLTYNLYRLRPLAALRDVNRATCRGKNRLSGLPPSMPENRLRNRHSRQKRQASKVVEK